MQKDRRFAASVVMPDQRLVVLGGYNNKEAWLDSVEVNPAGGCEFSLQTRLSMTFNQNLSSEGRETFCERFRPGTRFGFSSTSMMFHWRWIFALSRILRMFFFNFVGSLFQSLFDELLRLIAPFLISMWTPLTLVRLEHGSWNTIFITSKYWFPGLRNLLVFRIATAPPDHPALITCPLQIRIWIHSSTY